MIYTSTPTTTRLQRARKHEKSNQFETALGLPGKTLWIMPQCNLPQPEAINSRSIVRSQMPDDNLAPSVHRNIPLQWPPNIEHVYWIDTRYRLKAFQSRWKELVVVRDVAAFSVNGYMVFAFFSVPDQGIELNGLTWNNQNKIFGPFLCVGLF